MPLQVYGGQLEERQRFSLYILISKIKEKKEIITWNHFEFILILFIYFLFSVLGMEPNSSSLLGKCPVTELYAQLEGAKGLRESSARGLDCKN